MPDTTQPDTTPIARSPLLCSNHPIPGVLKPAYPASPLLPPWTPHSGPGPCPPFPPALDPAGVSSGDPAQHGMSPALGKCRLHVCPVIPRIRFWVEQSTHCPEPGFPLAGGDKNYSCVWVTPCLFHGVFPGPFPHACVLTGI